MTEKSTEDHYLDLLSTFHYVAGGITAFFALLPIIHLVVGILMLQGVITDNGEALPPFAGWLFVTLGSVFLVAGMVIAVLMLIAGSRIKQRVSHTFCMVVAGIECLLMPYGTVLGVLSLVQLTKPAVREMFDQPGV